MPAWLLKPWVPQAVVDNYSWRCCLFYCCLRWLGSISVILKQRVIASIWDEITTYRCRGEHPAPFGCLEALSIAGLGEAGSVEHLWWAHRCSLRGVPATSIWSPLIFPSLVFWGGGKHLLAWLFSVLFLFFFSPIFFSFFPVALSICRECVFNVSKMLASV